MQVEARREAREAEEAAADMTEKIAVLQQDLGRVKQVNLTSA